MRQVLLKKKIFKYIKALIILLGFLEFFWGFYSFRDLWANFTFGHESSMFLHTDYMVGRVVLTLFLEAVLWGCYIIVEALRKKKGGEVWFPWMQKHRAVKWSGIVFATLVAAFTLLYCNQEMLIFLPTYNTGYWQVNYAENKERYSDIEIDNGKYHAWTYTNEGNTKALVFFYGNVMNSAKAMELLARKNIGQRLDGFDLYSFDYPGYCRTEGAPTDKQIKAMVAAAIDYLDDIYEPQNIVFVGYSIGSGISAYAASKCEGCGGLMLIAPYYSTVALYNSYVPVFYGPLKYYVGLRFDTAAYIKALNCPVNIAASKDDITINYEQAENLSQESDRCTLITVEGFSHDDMVNDDYVWNIIVDEINGLYS